MDRRALLRAAAGAFLAAALSPSLAAQTTKPRLNFLLILCDDLGWGDIQPHRGPIQSPHLLQLAQEGLDATDYYAPANVGAPSRAGLLTGRYPVRTGVIREVGSDGKGAVLPAREVTIAAALKPDYATALIGEWGLGSSGEDWLPTRHGFDTFYGIAAGHDTAPVAIWDADAKAGKATSAPAEISKLQQQFADRAERFLEANHERPFFLELALSTPHVPAAPNAAFASRSTFGAYGDLIFEIDSIVGRMIAKLKSLHLERNTLVIFTSTNGAGLEGSNGPSRGRKGSAGYDGGYRVPFIAWGPGLVGTGMTSDAIIGGIDLLPTLVSMAGLAPPPGVELDGLDISAVIRRAAPSPHDEILLFDGEDLVGLRVTQWKYLEPISRTDSAVAGGSALPDQLYDEIRDRSESWSMASMNPYVVKDLRERLRRAREKFASFKRGTP